MMTAEHSNKNARLLEYTRLLIRLHDLIAEGHGETDEADTLREDMYDLWSGFDSEAAAYTRGLSADLYMLSNEEIFEQVAPEVRARNRLSSEIRRAWEARHWTHVLELLRRGPDFLAVDQIAYIRARCYANLGLLEASRRFLEYSIRDNPAGRETAFLTMLCYVEDPRIALQGLDFSAWDNASDPEVRLKATRVLLAAGAKLADPEEKQAILERASAVAQHIVDDLRSSSDRSGVAPALVDAYDLLGTSLANRGLREAAIQAYDAALELEPRNGIALAGRGVLKYPLDSDAAVADLTRAIESNVRSVAPYFYLALESLRKNDYIRCLSLCEEGLLRSPPARVKACLLEWKAISLAETGAPFGEVRPWFEAALAADPFNARIEHNLGTFESSHSRLTGALGDFQIEDNGEVEEFRAQLLDVPLVDPFRPDSRAA